MSVFERRRDSVNEDRRTWALFLALGRSPAFLRRFVTDALGELDLPIDTTDDITAAAWPRGFGRGQPDGLIQLGDRWQVVFEAKVPGNPLTTDQVERYLRQAGAFPGRRGFVAYLDEELIAADVRQAWEARGVQGMLLPHRRLLTLLADWSEDPELDPIAAFLARELLCFLREETGMPTLTDLAPADLLEYRKHAELIYSIDAQIQERLERVASVLGRRGLRAEVSRGTIGWDLSLGLDLSPTPFALGLTVEFAGDGGVTITRWVHVAAADMHDVHALRDAGRLPAFAGSAPPRADEAGVLWSDELPPALCTDFVTALAFPRAMAGILRSIVDMAKSAREIWPSFVAGYFDATRPHDVPSDLADRLREWLSAEASAGRTVHFGERHVCVSGRGGRGDTVELHWRGSPEFEGSDEDFVTVWADSMGSLRAVHAAPNWSDLHGGDDWRHVSVRSVIQLQRILGSIPPGGIRDPVTRRPDGVRGRA